MFSSDAELNFLAVFSFSGLLCISCPVSVSIVCVVGFAVMLGDVLRKVDPWKFLTVRLAKEYELPLRYG